MKDSGGYTALDWAVESNNTSAALFLSWLGAEEVTLQTWTSRVSKHYITLRAEIVENRSNQLCTAKTFRNDLLMILEALPSHLHDY